MASRERGRGWSLLLDRVLPSTARLVVLLSSWSEGDGGPPLVGGDDDEAALAPWLLPAHTRLRCTAAATLAPLLAAMLVHTHPRTAALPPRRAPLPPPRAFSPPLAMRRPSHRCYLSRRRPRLALLLVLLVALALDLPASSPSSCAPRPSRRRPPPRAPQADLARHAQVYRRQPLSAAARPPPLTLRQLHLLCASSPALPCAPGRARAEPRPPADDRLPPPALHRVARQERRSPGLDPAGRARRRRAELERERALRPRARDCASRSIRRCTLPPS